MLPADTITGFDTPPEDSRDVVQRTFGDTHEVTLRSKRMLNRGAPMPARKYDGRGKVSGHALTS